MSRKRVRVWVQQFRDRPMLVLQWHDPANGARRSKSAETTDCEAAEEARADLECKLNNQLYHEPNRLKWDQFRQMYEAEELAGLAEKTQQKAKGVFDVFERHMKPRRIEDISERTLSAYVVKLRELKRKAATINSHLRHMKRALNWAVEQGLLERRPRIKKLKEQKKLPRKITVEEFDRLLAKAPDPLWKAFMLTAWYSGLRLGELVSLRWDDVDFAGHRILVRAEVQGNKAKRDEWIPMHARLEPALRVLDPSTNFVFSFDWKSETVGRRFKELAVAAGLRCTAHDLRRSFCSRLAAEGVPLQIAQRLMRHASPTTTATYYTNVEDVLHQAVAKV